MRSVPCFVSQCPSSQGPSSQVAASPRAALFGLVGLVVAAAVAGEAVAAEFPYEARVVREGAEVRSAAGEVGYATARLAAGTPVRVVRHDPGGWVMIEPPPGSFSYIRPEYVQMLDGTRGIVQIAAQDGRPGMAVVRVGSQLSDEALSSGRVLRTGHEVHVLGRAIVQTGGGKMREMLRIEPPPREYRFIRGDAIAGPNGDALVAGFRPVEGGQAGAVSSTTPSWPTDGGEAVPVFTAPPSGESPGNGFDASGGGASPAGELSRDALPQPSPRTQQLDAEVDRTIASGAARRTGPALIEVQRQQQQLARLDTRFREMVKTPPDAWDLDGLEQEYTALFNATPSDAMKGLVAKRLTALQARREVHRRYLDFVRLTSETSRREQQLLEEQRASQQRLEELSQARPVDPSLGTPQTVGEQGPTPPSAPLMGGRDLGGQGLSNPARATAPGPAAEFGQPAGDTLESFGESALFGPNATGPTEAGLLMPPLASTATPPQGTMRFDGAGLIVPQQAPQGDTRYVLVSPAGKALALVQPAEGVDLTPHLKQPRGLVGDRRFDPVAGLDVLTVRRLQPVDLTPEPAATTAPGSVPTGSVPAGSVPAGSVPAASQPAPSLPPSFR